MPRRSARLAFLVLIMLTLSGCAGRVHDVLVPVTASAPGTSSVTLLVATTRSAQGAAAGEMFTGERSQKLSFAEITVSLPPDATRKIGDVQWPSSSPGDPAHDFVTTQAEQLDLAAALASFDARLTKTPSRRVLVFVHGFNNRFEEAVYRFAQIMHDSRAPAVPVLFTWPSRGKLIAYGYDRESATYSRDALERVLAYLVRDPKVSEVSVLAHSMGNWTALEALRQMSIRERGLPRKINTVMLAAPDVDVDVFRTQVADINAPATRFTMFVSQDDTALAVSRRVWGNVARVGAVNPDQEPYHSQFEKENIAVFDLTKLKTDDSLKHAKFAASPEVVRLIGERLVEGQAVEDDRVGLGERVGRVAAGAALTVGSAAALAVSAPFAIVDGRTRETLGDSFNQLGESAGDALKSTGGVVAPE